MEPSFVHTSLTTIYEIGTLSTNPKTGIFALIAEASKHLDQGRPEMAQQILDQAEQGDVNFDVAAALGQIFLRMEQTAKAIGYFTLAIDGNEGDPRLLTLLAAANLKAGQTPEAEDLLRKALKLEPEFTDALMNLGAALINQGRYDDADEILHQALKQKPGNASVLANLATVSCANGDTEEAEKLAKRSLKKNPANSNMYMLLARMNLESGRTDEAIYQYNKAIGIDQFAGQAYNGLAYAKKYTRNDIPAITRYENALNSGMPAASRSHIHFALGKMKDDLGEYDEAFRHYQQANLLANKAYDESGTRLFFKHFKQVFSADRLATLSGSGHGSDEPVFIAGMPRSGTSLVEQIISSHREAGGAGEFGGIEDVVKALCDPDNLKGVKQACESNLVPDKLRSQAAQYLNILRNRAMPGKRIVDKTPGNYLYLGLIRVLFPKAKIVHVMRNPLDNCLSCYFQDFENLPWSFDLKHVAQRYNFYREVMSHWTSVFPDKSILDIQYETLIDRPKDETRRLIAFLGLPWDSACLEFYKANRAVKTASMWQVRQPIYKTSRMRALHYAKYLTELANNLKKHLPDDPELLGKFGIRKKFLGII